MSDREPVSWYYETELLETTCTKFLHIPTDGTTFWHQSNIKATWILCGLGIKRSKLWSSSFSPQKWKMIKVANVNAIFLSFITVIGGSWWLPSLRCGPMAICLLILWVWIPLGSWVFVSCECCLLSGRGLCDRLITHPEESCQMWHVNVKLW